MKNYVKQLILAVKVFIEQLVLRVYLQVFARFNVFGMKIGKLSVLTTNFPNLFLTTPS